MLGLAASAGCRSDKEKDRNEVNFSTGDDDKDSQLVGLLACGGKGGRQRLGDEEFELEALLLLLIVAARANVLLELADLFDIPPLLLLKLLLKFLSKKYLCASKFLRRRL